MRWGLWFEAAKSDPRSAVYSLAQKSCVLPETTADTRDDAAKRDRTFSGRLRVTENEGLGDEPIISFIIVANRWKHLSRPMFFFSLNLYVVCYLYEIFSMTSVEQIKTCHSLPTIWSEIKFWLINFRSSSKMGNSYHHVNGYSGDDKWCVQEILLQWRYRWISP